MSEIIDLVCDAFADENEGFVALKIVAVIEALDPEGNVVLMNAVTEGLPAWAAMGMLRAAQLDLEDDWRMSAEEDCE